MANTISWSCALSLVGTGVSLSGAQSGSASQSGSTGIGNVQNIGTSYEALSFVDATPSGGWLLVANLDATNYVEVDNSNTGSNFPQKITAGTAVLLRPQTNTIYAKANTGACNCYVVGVTP